MVTGLLWEECLFVVGQEVAASTPVFTVTCGESKLACFKTQLPNLFLLRVHNVWGIGQFKFEFTLASGCGTLISLLHGCGFKSSSHCWHGGGEKKDKSSIHLCLHLVLRNTSSLRVNWPEKIARDKHYSLLCPLISGEETTFNIWH